MLARLDLRLSPHGLGVSLGVREEAFPLLAIRLGPGPVERADAEERAESPDRETDHDPHHEK